MDAVSKKRVSEYINRKLSEGRLILFTGAGFSMGANDCNGVALPSGNALAQELWKMAFPDQEFDDSSLPDIYDAARMSGERALTDYLTKRFSVDSNSLPSWYETYIRQPWYKSYTLNLDNLMDVAASKFNLNRRIVSLSKHDQTTPNSCPKDLVIRHLNGTIHDLPNDVVFTDQQYGLQLATPDPIYTILTAELLKHPFVFIGSILDESTLWQHIALRRRKGRIHGIKETRPNSLLVIPRLSKARQKSLADFNITWLPMTAEEFAKDFLIPNESATLTGFANLKRMTDEKFQQPESIPLVSNLISTEKELPQQNAHYLLGASPKWIDITSGMAIEREKDSVWLNQIRQEFVKKRLKTPIYVFTGTAGDGKTTFAMKIAAQLSSEGKIIGWLDEDHSIPPQKINHLVDSTPGIEGLFIDTPGIYGTSIINPLIELCKKKTLKFVALVVRSAKVDRLLEHSQFDSITKIENPTYNLNDSEINLMLDRLRDTNLLGALKGKDRVQQFNIFKEVAQRQLIVAMIEATSGKQFIEKVCDEFESLEPESKEIYCLVAVATSIGHYLKASEILMSIDESSNTAANRIQDLTKRGLFQLNEFKGLKVRHKTIGETVAQRLADDNELIDYYTRLANIAAISLMTEFALDTRMKRLLKYTLSHQRLRSIGSYEKAQSLYSYIESIQHNNHHYWLQRGSLELEFGNLNLAQNYLNQARALNQNDPYVALACASLGFKQANTNPRAPEAKRIMEEAYNTLEELIESRGAEDSYPFHVLGHEGLHWTRKAIESKDEKRVYLEKIQRHVKEGRNIHRADDFLVKLDEDLQKEILNLAVKD